MRILAQAAALVLAVSAALPVAATEIGRVSVSWQDPARGNRSVGVELYYPATVAGSGAPLATPPPGGFPVVVFGHGFQMVVTAYENVWTALVPEGYVVALPTTGGELFPNHAAFGADLAFVVERLRAENGNAASFLHQKLSGKTAVMGHSMGGGASLLAADADPTIDALAVLAPAETNPSAIGAAAGIAVPTLVFSGTKDCVAPASQHQVPMYNASASTCKTYVSIQGGSHCQFGINSTLCNLGEIFCGGAGISRATQHAILNSLLLPWLDGVLRMDWQRWQSFEATLVAGSGFTAQQSCPVSPAPPPACANGIDDDVDGAIDFPADTGCTSVNDIDEQFDCVNGIDDDGDGAIDSADAGCNLAQFGTESPQCQDGIDNDGDGAIDYPADTLCQGPWDPDEAANPPPASCGLLGPEALLVLAALRLRSRARR